MIVLRAPKGWTGPKEIKGHKAEGSWRSHQVPFSDVRENPDSLKLLESWLKSYQPQELFDANGRLIQELRELAPERRAAHERQPACQRRAAAQGPEASRLPRSTQSVSQPRAPSVTRTPSRSASSCATSCATTWAASACSDPDETASNRLQAIYEVSKKTWMADLLPEDADGGELSRDGRVMEMLSEHTLIGWLEGYLLSGRHGFFHTYEAFAHVVDSMFNQHAKWLDICKNHVPWRASVASQNILLSSTVWRQDHNGFSHQDPGFIDVVTNKSPTVTRIYLPPDANYLLVVADQCLRSTDCINVIVADKQKHLQFTHHRRGDRALRQGHRHLGARQQRRGRGAGRGDRLLRGRAPPSEALAAVAILRERLPDLKVRFVNVVDLFKMQPASEHPHGSTEREFDSLFTTSKPVIFNFHGYPWLIHKLAYRFTNHENLHVRGYKEKGNINTPLELAILNQIDRFNLVIDVIDRVPRLTVRGAHLKEEMKNAIIDNLNYARTQGTDREEISNWVWPY